MPPWIPSGLQKKVFQYILTRLEVFSNIDPENIQVSLGTTSKLAVSDVQLDTDKLSKSIPGVYVRDATVNHLEVSLGVTGVQVAGSDVDITVAVNKRSEDPELVNLLSRTTADLAESVIDNESGLEAMKDSIGSVGDEDGEKGYGGFSNMITRIAEAAISQVTVKLTNLKLHVVCADAITIHLSIQSVVADSSEELRRNLVFEDMLIELENPEHNLGDNNEYNDEEDESDDDHYDPHESNLMQSTLFSHEEASTMYMSAMSAIASGPPAPPAKREFVFSADTIRISFVGLAFAHTQLRITSAKGSVASLCSLGPLVDIVQDYAAMARANSEEDLSPNENSKDGTSFESASIDKLELEMEAASGQDACIISLEKFLLKFEDLSTLIQLKRLGASFRGQPVLWMDEEQDGSDSSDLSCRIDSQSVKILMPNSGTVKLTPESLAILAGGVDDVFYLLGLLGGEGASQDQMHVVFQSNVWKASLQLENNEFEVTVLPTSFDSHTNLRVGQITATLNGEQCIKASVGELFIQDNDPVAITTGGAEVPGKVKNKLAIEHIDANLNLQALLELGKDMAVVFEERESHRKNRQTQRPKDDPMDNATLKFKRTRLEEQVDFSITVGGVDSILDTVEIGPLFADIHGIELNIIQGGRVQLNINDAGVKKDFPDENIQKLPIIYKRAASKEPMIFVELMNGEPDNLTLRNAVFEYHIRLLKLFESDKDETSESLADSTATVRESAEFKLPIYMVDCVIGLNPYKLNSRGELMIRNATSELRYGGNEVRFSTFVRRASVYLTDDTKAHHQPEVLQHRPSTSELSGNYLKRGYVLVAMMTGISAKLYTLHEKFQPRLELDISGENVSLETCADSSQTLVQVLNGLKPIVEGDQDVVYHTEVLPLDVLQSIDEAAFARPIAPDDEVNVDMIGDDIPSNLDFVESYYGDRASRSQWSSSGSSSQGGEYSKADLLLDQDLSVLAQKSRQGMISEFGDSSQRKLDAFEQRVQQHDSTFDVNENYFSQMHNSMDDDVQSNDSEVPDVTRKKRREPLVPPVKVKIDSIIRVVWNLYDGFDWAYTRNAISNAVAQVEDDAQQALHKSEIKQWEEEEGGDGAESEENKEVVSDLLFNSIYIGIPEGQDPENLRRTINKNIDEDATSEVSVRSHATTASGSNKRKPKLQLHRSRRNKVLIELREVSADMLIYATINDSNEQRDLVAVNGEDGELLNRVDLRVKNFEIIDNVPTSTWNKFVTYMRSSGDREWDADMIHLIMDTVKPIPSIAASEAIISVHVLPLRLHVDQDTLDFLTRFFEFKDDRVVPPPGQKEDVLFIQKFDISAIKVKLDYKPKKVDYVGLKSGRVTEFMNFFILDEAEMVLRRVVLYGVPGIPRLAQMLNGIWMPDIRTTQLGDVLAGIAPVKSLVRLGSGVRDLVAVPVREYRKDGRVVRSVQKGAWSFARNTTNELVRFGAKLAAGTQTILESAEQAMGGEGRAAPPPTTSSHRQRGGGSRKHVSPYSDDLDIDSADDDEPPMYEGASALDDDDRTRKVSLYANPPISVAQGLQDAYGSLGRNLGLARQAIMGIGPNTVDQGGNAQDAARAVMKAAPIALIRPVIGATEAVSKTLQGVTNQMDPGQVKNIEEKYKRPS